MSQLILDRPRYTQLARPYFGNPLIKILTGQRRVGKSCMLKSLAELYRRERAEWRVVYIDKELTIKTSIIMDNIASHHSSHTVYGGFQIADRLHLLNPARRVTIQGGRTYHPLSKWQG